MCQSLLTGWIGRDEKGREAPGRRFKIISTLPLDNSVFFPQVLTILVCSISSSTLAAAFGGFWFWPLSLLLHGGRHASLMYCLSDGVFGGFLDGLILADAMMLWFPFRDACPGPLVSLWSVWGQLCHPRWSAYQKLSVERFSHHACSRKDIRTSSRRPGHARVWLCKADIWKAAHESDGYSFFIRRKLQSCEAIRLQERLAKLRGETSSEKDIQHSDIMPQLSGLCFSIWLSTSATQEDDSSGEGAGWIQKMTTDNCTINSIFSISLWDTLFHTFWSGYEQSPRKQELRIAWRAVNMMQKHDVNMYSSLEFSTLRVAECFLDPGRQTCVKEAWLSFQLNIRLRLLFLYKALQKSASLLCCSAFCTFSSGSHIHWTQRPRQRCSLSLRRKCHRMDQVRCFTIQCFNFYPLAFHFPSSWRHKLHDDTLKASIGWGKRKRCKRKRRTAKRIPSQFMPVQQQRS